MICGALLGGGVALAGVEGSLKSAGENAPEIQGFLAQAAERHGAFGERAATFLVEGMPPSDLRSLDTGFLVENLDLAMRARKEFPWAVKVPEEVFFNDVLPYASLDETRERWRHEFYPQCAAIVKDCTTATEAAQALNREFFDVIGVHYDTGRKAPNQSPSESKKLGKASCTGLSIILVNACRAVGVPARVAGTPMWSDKRGNHTWVEIQDGGEWFFTGADEYDAKGLNRAWFAKDASKAIADDWRHAIWATSWQRTGERFPMVWNLASDQVPGVNVTTRYIRPGEAGGETAEIHLRFWDKRGGERMAAAVEVVDARGEQVGSVTTRAGTADLNDMPSVKLQPGKGYRLRVAYAGERRGRALEVSEPGATVIDLIWSDLTPE
jgi:hypothetical protein